MFEEFVDRVIRHRLKKNQQPGHPNRISQDEVNSLFQKSRRAIIDAEREVTFRLQR